MAFHWKHRQEWRLRGASGDVLVLEGEQLLMKEQERRVPEGLIAFQMNRWMGDASSRRVLFELHEALGGVGVPLGMTVLEQQQVHERIQGRLLEAFRNGRLVALYEEHYRVSPPPRPPRPAPSPASEEEPVATSWLALRLEDEDGTALAGQRYRLKLADGSVREGVSGPEGLVRLEGIPEGSCTVEFPGTDAGDWRAA